QLSGHETIHFVNRSNSALNELWFHLYLNAFKNDKTLFLRSPFGAGRSGDKAHEYGYVDIKKMIWVEADHRDLWPDRDRHSPGDPDDETDLRVPLPQPLEPGQGLSLELEFEDKLPQIVERMGYMGSFHFLGQWFPKLALLEPSGRFSHFAFHAQSEFYADFGDYDVTLDVPEAFVVGATGALDRQSQDKGRKRLHYHAENVHDFAWAAWDQFQTRSERIAGTLVSVLYPPHQEANAEAELDSVRFALPHFNDLYGRYPYPTLTLVHPPEAAGNAGGMEYPTLITTGGPWYSTFGGGHFIDVVTTHELGHQWFYGLCASNEHNSPFLDEGLNSYAEAEALEARYGPGSVFDGFGLRVSSTAVNRTVSAARGGDEPVAEGAADFASFRNLGALVYSRTATIMTTLARVYGEQRLRHALGSYTRKFRFQHPTPSDLLGVMQEELGSEAATALSRALFERGTIDYLVREISNAPETAAAGVFDSPNGREQKKPEPEPTHPPAEYASRVVVYRHGSLELPVEIELICEDGSRERRHWDGHGFTHNVDHVGPSRLVSVSVDPEQKILLDDDLSNNWASTKGASAPRSLERALYFAQGLLGGLGP
ncbi:MAG TPA: M1 family metallopeptidase, partial [Polyangiaceae bacterium]|nr:M1 family metallopeptidase [Polyangiaceae bacterium]